SATVSSYRPGYVVNTLPPYYQTEIIGGVRYYHYDNVYYRPRGNRYIVVAPPRGGRGWADRSRYGRPDRYDRRDDRYDRRDDRGDGRYDRDDRRDGYDRGRTTVIRTLPSGARVMTHRGTRYYRAGDTYYLPSGDGYVLVERPR
ncbi:MAG TPA: DUF6515 family protein, partial [Verrucomicrobiales bacterium]|nr:DUF6515 family protein [Verrucomicrobiales bacterium]